MAVYPGRVLLETISTTEDYMYTTRRILYCTTWTSPPAAPGSSLAVAPIALAQHQRGVSFVRAMSIMCGVCL